MRNRKTLITIAFVFACMIHNNISLSCTQPPVVFLFSDNDKCIGDVYNFNATAYDPDGGSIVSYQWSFDPNAYDITGQGTAQTSCKYNKPGFHTVTVLVKDDEGESAQDSITVYVRHYPDMQGMIIPYFKWEIGYHEFFWIFPDVFYSSHHTCWCSHYTEHSGLEFDHSHTPHGYPFDVDYDHDGLPEIIVYSSDTDAFFDSTSFNIIDGYIRVSSATCEYNCFGYATGKNIWIQGFAIGIEKILGDDYELCWSDGEIAYSSDHIHAKKIESFYPNGHIEKTTEKDAMSGVYLKFYPETGGGLDGSYSFYKKKP